MTEELPKNSQSLQAASLYDVIRISFTLKRGDVWLMCHSRMDDNAPNRKTKVSDVFQTISRYADGVTAKKSSSSDHEDFGGAERFFAGKRMFVHIKECPRTTLDERWPYSIILNAIQNEYWPTQVSHRLPSPATRTFFI
jgi:hypothetical protein